MSSEKLKKILEFEDDSPNVKRPYTTPSMEKYKIAPKRAAGSTEVGKEPAAEANPEALTAQYAKSAESTEAVLIRTNETVIPLRNHSKQRKKRSRTASYIGRAFLAIGTAILFVLVSVISALCVIAYGPSETVRNMLVLSAKQASATKWAPGLFFDDETVNKILDESTQVVVDDVDMNDYVEQIAPAIAELSNDGGDMWASAKDGMIYTMYSGTTYKAYILLIKDPARVFTGISSENFASATQGMCIFEMADKYNAVAVINGGEFRDVGGMGSGAQPMGITYSKGNMVYSDGLTGRTFIGFNKDNKLVVREGMTQVKSEELGIRDGVCFQTGNVLIDNCDGTIKFHYADGDTATAQRTAIGQCADGTVIFIVTDGRTASSIGATRNDIINLLSSYGAVSAGMLDGGSSAMMYYRDYYIKYGMDASKLDEYQARGLVNKYKAFTAPRTIPTYFVVAGG